MVLVTSFFKKGYIPLLHRIGLKCTRHFESVPIDGPTLTDSNSELPTR